MSGRPSVAPPHALSPRDREAKKNKDLVAAVDDVRMPGAAEDMKPKRTGSKESTQSRGAMGTKPPRMAGVATNGKLADTRQHI